MLDSLYCMTNHILARGHHDLAISKFNIIRDILHNITGLNDLLI